MSKNKVYTAIGMMSGTSLDGVDVALIETDGKDLTTLLDFKTFDYKLAEKQAIKDVFGATKPSKKVLKAENAVTQAHIRALREFGHKADVIGFHGQTISHNPAQKFTWQIGDAQIIADETQTPVIADMRQADIAAGGQGAPLLPLCHRSFAATTQKPIAILNLGGVGNITWLGRDRMDILAFDTGPANAPIDDLVQAKTGQAYDSNGARALAGRPLQSLIDDWLSHPFFDKTPPKSLDRNQWDVSAVAEFDLNDAIATLAQFSVQSVLKSLKHLPAKPHALYVAGGGRHNKAMMTWLNEALDYPVLPVEDIGWNGDALEAQGFGYLAVRSLLGLALTLPTTTGVPEPLTGGALYTPFVTRSFLAANTK
ncbi:MAG: anhydro-N-acetylmuramic acid kinase [Alphaproteobacteria bacterium]|nr:anhydro-N-acetylmuramic acid kinase [Alphaproteobacteria bacterium]NCQ88780.1 anhydro-N-acetylmuramic acid kinase [Alphaproteobacteria bacterium]NCT07297.1 anhydro-N-acetylmuramic acid kinase [Alphaproteobacteria bacterium]